VSLSYTAASHSEIQSTVTFTVGMFQSSINVQQSTIFEQQSTIIDQRAAVVFINRFDGGKRAFVALRRFVAYLCGQSSDFQLNSESQDSVEQWYRHS